jgi:hypothetical protein
MKWLGYQRTSPVDPTPGAMDTALNTRLAVEGEVRNRRGMARSSLPKIGSAVKAISDFAFSPGSPYAVILGNGTVDGDDGISSQWGDSNLIPLSGSSSPSSGSSFALTVNRNGCDYADGAFIFAYEPGYPTDTSGNTLVGFVSLANGVQTATTTWTAPYSASWKFRVYPRHFDQVGPGANLTVCADISWSATNKGPGVTLSNGSVRATCASGDTVRTDTGWATGRHQIEFICRGTGTAGAARAGYLFSGASYSGALGDDAFGFGWASAGPYWNNAFSGGSLSTFTVGDVLGVRYDARTTGVVTLSKNGSDVGSFTIGIGTIYPAVSDGPAGLGGCVFDIVPVSLAYPVSGFVPWGSLT